MSDFSKDELIELLGKDIPEEDSPYCKDCTACGEEGCCSPLMCFSKLVQKDTCMYGKGYLLDIELALKFTEWVFEYVDKNDVLTVKDANRKYRELIDKIYHKENEDE